MCRGVAGLAALPGSSPGRGMLTPGGVGCLILSMRICLLEPGGGTGFKCASDNLPRGGAGIGYFPGAGLGGVRFPTAGSLSFERIANTVPDRSLPG